MIRSLFSFLLLEVEEIQYCNSFHIVHIIVHHRRTLLLTAKLAVFQHYKCVNKGKYNTHIIITFLVITHYSCQHIGHILNLFCVLYRAPNEGSRRFHNHGSGPYFPILCPLTVFMHPFSIVSTTRRRR